MSLFFAVVIVVLAFDYVFMIFWFFFFFKQKTAYEMRISDWSSDVCSSDLRAVQGDPGKLRRLGAGGNVRAPAAHRLLVFRQRLGLSFKRNDDQEKRHHEIGRASCRERVCQYV